ncbi:hypothetical protein [Rickettsia tamurae]|uniref:hypothetical protein n=1 Tax=Rickettsia tamurae TaxID=334545 RepID=UPI003081DCE2
MAKCAKVPAKVPAYRELYLLLLILVLCRFCLSHAQGALLLLHLCLNNASFVLIEELNS